VRAGVPARALNARHVAAVARLALAAEGRVEAHLPSAWRVRRAAGVLRVTCRREKPL
jgi:hypothetical protein